MPLPEKIDRNRAIVWSHIRGHRTVDIARKYGVTPWRAWDIINRYKIKAMRTREVKP